MKVLIIGHRSESGDFVETGLAEEGFNVDLARTGTDGLHLAGTGTYEVVVLDSAISDMDRWQLLKAIRANASPRVILLTARGAVDERITGLQLGADDCLSKPFAYSELLARIHALVRRKPPRPREVVAVGDLEVDLVRRRITRAGQCIALTGKEFALLSCLMHRPGQVLSRTLITELVWDAQFNRHTNFVDVAMRRLRAKVDDAYPEKMIRTVRGVGYALEPPLASHAMP